MNTRDTRSLILFGIAFLIAITIIFLPLQSVPSQAQKCLAISIAVLFLWITNAFPFHVSGLIGITALALTGTETLPNLIQYGFGNSVIIFFLAVMIIASCIKRTSLIKRITLKFLIVTGSNCKYIILLFLIIGSLLTPFFTKIITFTILLSIAQEMLSTEHIVARKSNFGKALMLACLWGPTLGSMGSISAAPPNALAVSLLESITRVSISFGTWFLYGIPVIALSIIPAWGLLIVLFPPEFSALTHDKSALRARIAALPPLSTREVLIASIFFAIVVSWIGSDLINTQFGIRIPPSLPPLLGSCLLLIPPFFNATWKDIETTIPWSALLLIATASAIGIGLYRTGAAQIVAALLLPLSQGLPIFFQSIVFLTITILLRALMASNSAATAFLTPMIASIAPSFPGSLTAVVMPAIIFSAVSFFLPTASPTNALSYAQGYYTMKDLVKSGVIMTAVCIVITASLRIIMLRFL